MKNNLLFFTLIIFFVTLAAGYITTRYFLHETPNLSHLATMSTFITIGGLIGRSLRLKYKE